MRQIPELAWIVGDAVDHRPGHRLGFEAAGDQLGTVSVAEPFGPQPLVLLLDSQVRPCRSLSGAPGRARCTAMS